MQETFATRAFLSSFAPLMKKSLFALSLVLVVAVGGYGQPSAYSKSETSFQLFSVVGAVHLTALPLVDHPSSKLYGPVMFTDEGSELCLEEKEEKEEQDHKAKSSEFQFYSCRAASIVAPHRPSIKLPSKLYLLQAVLRI